MNTEDEIHYKGVCIRLVEAPYSKMVPWRAWDDHGFLAGGMTRDKVIEAAKLTIDNRHGRSV